MEKNWIKRTILFLGGQTISLLGSSIVQFAISWHITLVTKSGVMLTIATLCGFLPQVFISLFAGVWADRYNRKHLIMIADSMIAICTAILAILFTMGYQHIWLLFFISIIRSIGAGIQTPAVSAFLTEIVPQKELMRVNGINASITSIILLLSPAAAGGLYDIMGMESIFWVDVVTAFIGISLLVILKVKPRKVQVQGTESFSEELFLGIHYVFDTKWLRQLMIFYLFIALMLGPVIFLTPLMVVRSFGAEAWRLVAHEMVFSVGSVAGGLLVGIYGSRLRNQVHIILFACLFFGLTTFLLGFSFNFWFYLGVMLPMGITMPFINTGFMTLLQTKVSPDLIGRVFGLVTIIGSSAMPLSMVVFGPLADFMSVELQLIITGAIMFVISLVMFRFREIIAIGEMDPVEE